MTLLGDARTGGTANDMQQVQGPSPEGKWRRVAKGVTVGAAGLGLTTFLSYVGYFTLYAFYGPYDDEGYWLISIRSYQLHGSLYHKTFSQAGPFYSEFWSLVYSAFGMPVNWDTGRRLTLVVWIATCVVMGVAVWILSRRVLLGVLAEVVSFLVMYLLSGVAMEPAGLAHFMGAIVLLGLALFVRERRRLGVVLIGAAAPAAVFTKVNIGVFIVAGLAAALALSWPSRNRIDMRKVVVALLVLLFPVLLMAQVLQAPWAWHYCVLELLYLGGLCVVILTKTDADDRRCLSSGELYAGIGAALASAVVIALGVLSTGTSLSQLVYGAFLSQRGLARGFLHQQAPLALPVADPYVLVAIVSCVVAVFIGASRIRGSRWHGWLDSVGAGYLRLAAGFWILLTITQGFVGWTGLGLVVAPGVATPAAGMSFLLAAPFAWLAALGGRDRDADHQRFARYAICLIGVLSCLEGFPVAGSQVLWAAVGLIPVGVLCIIDGVSMISSGRTRRWVASAWAPSLVSVLAVVLTVSLTLGTVGRTLNIWHETYHQNVSVGLPGAQRVRLPLRQVEQLRQVTGFLKAHCSTYWSVPGLNSFYFFSGETPPTGLNSTQSWWNSLTWNQQKAVLGSLVRTPGLCLLEDNEYLSWHHIINTPLVHYIDTNFVAVESFARYPAWTYQVFVRRSDHAVQRSTPLQGPVQYAPPVTPS